jgi:hypothetical protein
LTPNAFFNKMRLLKCRLSQCQTHSAVHGFAGFFTTFNCA